LICFLDSSGAQYIDFTPLPGSTFCESNVNRETRDQFGYGLYQPENGKYFFLKIACLQTNFQRIKIFKTIDVNSKIMCLIILLIFTILRVKYQLNN